MRIPQVAFGLLGTLLVAPILQGADEAVSIREVYWQTLPFAWVYVNNSGEPWFRKVSGDANQGPSKETRLLSHDQVMLLGDRAGRLWINPLWINPRDPSKRTQSPSMARVGTAITTAWPSGRGSCPSRC